MQPEGMFVVKAVDVGCNSIFLSVAVEAEPIEREKYQCRSSAFR